MTTRSNRNVRMRKSVEVLEWVEALPAVASGAIPNGLAVVTDYLSYWLDYEKGAVLSLGSIENYVLGWCEDPTEDVIATLINLGELAKSDRARACRQLTTGHKRPVDPYPVDCA